MRFLRSFPARTLQIRDPGYLAAMIIGIISSCLQIIGLLVYHDVFIERMTWSTDREGIFNRLVWHHVEDFYSKGDHVDGKMKQRKIGR